ncbi:putative TetR family transcriptional regulator [Caenibius tardaugens NBRC 16725]|uniref:Putative TetR family transcriptional regulator n=1 Tax=Caenibius tardaugens NBRC 16725 TaxID=1219035 RepID=U2ZT40_9SPHN|nr:TetR/AcrR family transcriptional regulator [Caenibius tardaugens]AZI34992.1 TetR/AcrR family transcriptional regulator [Caenibius tardaugens NBRC 16725]GAD48544.1 putative TetR family transcriptional regulator [Caenibius tardaugens NBRC 16725]
MTKLLSRRELNKERTRNAILRAAREGFAREGVSGMTMDDIASEADVSRTTLFNYFTGKGEILDHLVMEMHEHFYARMEECRASTADVEKRLVMAFSETGRLMENDAYRLQPLVGYSWLRWNEAGIMGRIERLTESFEELLDDGRERPSGEGPDLHAIAEIATAVFIGMIHKWHLVPDFPLAQRLSDAAAWIMLMLQDAPERAFAGGQNAFPA